MLKTNPIKYTSLNLFGSVLAFCLQFLLVEKLGKLNYGEYRLELVFFPLICLLLNPGMDIKILTNKYSNDDFLKIYFSKIILFLIFSLIIFFTFLFLNNYFSTSIPIYSFLAMCLGALVGQTSPCLRNFLFANGFVDKTAISYEFTRIFGIILAFFLVYTIPINIPLGLLITTMLTSTGGPFTLLSLFLIYRLFYFSYKKNNPNLKKNILSKKSYFLELKDGFLLSTSTTSLYGVEIFYNYVSAQILGPTEFGFLSLVLMPFNEFKRIGRLITTVNAPVFINFHNSFKKIKSLSEKINKIKNTVSRIFNSNLEKYLKRKNIFLFLFILLSIFFINFLDQKYSLSANLFIFWILLLFIKPFEVITRNLGSFVYYHKFEYYLILIRSILFISYWIIANSLVNPIHNGIFYAYLFYLLSEISSIVLYYKISK